MSASIDRLGDGLAVSTVFTDPVDMLAYRRDCSVVRPGDPDLVARVRDVAEVQAAVARAARERQPVYVRGGGTMYAGGINPHAGGVVVDTGGMDRVLELDLARGVVVVEPGIRFAALIEFLRPHGQTIGIVPLTGPAATVGGAVSAHALGSGSPRQQGMGDCVAGLEVVLPDGTLLRTGSAAADGAGFFQRYCIGPDLTGLFIGADATFGVVTAIALWLYPVPSSRDTVSIGFAGVAEAGRFLAAVQGAELTRNTWYAAGYEGSAVRARVAAADAAADLDALPGFCTGFDLGGDAAAVAGDRARLLELAAHHGGRECRAFDAAYFRRLRYDETYWYSYAGYFTRSRCAILMSSLPCDRLEAFVATVDGLRGRWPDYPWGAAVVLCRRGLHGGVLAFYDERTAWDAVTPAIDDAADALVAAGCVPYKSAKQWAPQVRGFGAYSATLGKLKSALDPDGLFAPGNLGL
ncbi:MAG: FAD-binding oxidoreductase [Gammaproteobacteria bacterium]|nr:FAD-binding oxidoreductase [Gammaproteobacteria bacterium]MCP5202320.1 FAD-binding oxidoreductase [Gammaproteobacteria bacterium]